VDGMQEEDLLFLDNYGIYINYKDEQVYFKIMNNKHGFYLYFNEERKLHYISRHSLEYGNKDIEEENFHYEYEEALNESVYNLYLDIAHHIIKRNSKPGSTLYADRIVEDIDNPFLSKIYKYQKLKINY
jgi:hypothetical protein